MWKDGAAHMPPAITCQETNRVTTVCIRSWADSRHSLDPAFLPLKIPGIFNWVIEESPGDPSLRRCSSELSQLAPSVSLIYYCYSPIIFLTHGFHLLILACTPL